MAKKRTRKRRGTTRARASGRSRPKRAAKARSKRATQRRPAPFYAFYGEVSEAAAPARGTMSSEFLEAVHSGPTAAAKLRRFLKQYDPGNGEYEDGFHRNRVRAAQVELMRLEYLDGRVAAGDRLLARLQDVTD